MKTSTRKRIVQDSYLEMILQFPLRPLRNDRELTRATALLDKWLPRDDMEEGQEDYIRVLADLVFDYEQKHNPVALPEFTPLQKLSYLIDQSGITSAQLAIIMGCSPSLVSLIQNGKRELSKANIRKLADHFHVQPGYFF